jgi:hypothetical protein
VNETLRRGARREFENVTLGDRRLDRRLEAIVARAEKSPSASFPKMVPSVAEREGFYRFVENERVDYEAVIEPHMAATAERCRGADVVLVSHDNTWCTYAGDREGLGPIAHSNQRGFSAHVSLAVSADERHAPLGIVNLSTFVRPDTVVARTKQARAVKREKSRRKNREDKESARWMDGVRAAEARLGGGGVCIHVMDQEGDNFAIFADLVEEQLRFVIRGTATRRLDHRGKRDVNDALDEVTAQAFRSVPVEARRRRRSGHPRRDERIAKLMIRATAIVLPRPEHAQHATKRLHLNVVHVYEAEPPAGEEPIAWTLYTTEPIDSPAAVTQIVDHYRARWRIEEFFKALKTGCAFEKRQLTTYSSLRRALALLAPIAWHLLAIRVVARDADEQPASLIVDEVQLEVLRVLAPGSKLPARPTASDVMRAIAEIGGHIRQNGEPGWIVLGRGYEDFVKAELVWRAATRVAAK